MTGHPNLILRDMNDENRNKADCVEGTGKTNLGSFAGTIIELEGSSNPVGLRDKLNQKAVLSEFSFILL